MDSRYAIELKDVEKSFKVYTDKGNTLKERVLFRKRNEHENRQVLKGISLRIEKGQAVGLIGKNGCGKSTTLKLLTRILSPTKGNVIINGRVSSLIELGAGFHPDMSGRENIYINASIFGLKKSEITERLDEIIKFSELEEFIDNPVRTYSSGMYMRLAFAVAINVNADILLIDEILAVGDVSFQKKCFDRLKEIRRQGTTIVIVSHDMTQLYNICDRLIWLEDGIIKDDGIPEKVGMKYLDSMEETRIARLAKESQDNFQSDDRLALLSLADNVHPDAHRFGTHEANFTHIEVLDGRGKSARIFSTGDKLTLVIDFETSLEHPSVNFNMDLVNDSGQYCYGSCMAKAGDILPVLEANGTVIFEIDRLMLLPGKYFLDLGINGTDGELYDNLRNIIQISVRDYPHNEFGPCTFEHHWEMR